MNLLQKIRYRLTPLRTYRTAGVEYNPDPKIDKLLFICGLHRSGTTLLEQYISSRFEVSALRADVDENEGQFLQWVYKRGWKYGGPGQFASDPRNRRDLEKITNWPRNRRRLLRQWSDFVVGDSSVLLEKSPPNITKIDWLRKTFPQSHFVIFVRDPRAVAGATHKWTERSLAELMVHWDQAHRWALADYREDDCDIVRYEDFCEDPEGVISRTKLDTFLDRREKPLDVDERFANLKNANAKYIEAHRDARYGNGVWTEFGYDF